MGKLGKRIHGVLRPRSSSDRSCGDWPGLVTYELWLVGDSEVRILKKALETGLLGDSQSHLPGANVFWSE